MRSAAALVRAAPSKSLTCRRACASKTSALASARARPHAHRRASQRILQARLARSAERVRQAPLEIGERQDSPVGRDRHRAVGGGCDIVDPAHHQKRVALADQRLGVGERVTGRRCESLVAGVDFIG